MRKRIVLIFISILFAGVTSAQNQNQDFDPARLQQLLVKAIDTNDLLMNELTKLQANNKILGEIINQILKVTTLDEIDKILEKYGLKREALIPVEKKE